MRLEKKAFSGAGDPVPHTHTCKLPSWHRPGVKWVWRRALGEMPHEDERACGLAESSEESKRIQR